MLNTGAVLSFAVAAVACGGKLASTASDADASTDDVTTPTCPTSGVDQGKTCPQKDMVCAPTCCGNATWCSGIPESDVCICLGGAWMCPDVPKLCP